MSFECPRSSSLVAVFLIAYVALWTATTYSLDPTVPYDALEALNWASNGEYGSPKNPYFVGAVTAFGLLLEPAIPLSLYWYLSHFVAVGFGMLGVWLLGKRLFGDNQIALLSLMSLNISGIINFDIIPYNDNYLLVMFWPYIFLFFIKAIYDNPYHWFSLSIVAGFAAMSKYSSCAFLPFMFVCTLAVPEARKAYRSPIIYLAILLLPLIALPNIIWLCTHDFAAFNWVESQLTVGLNTKLPGVLITVFYPAIALALILNRLGARWVLPVAPEKKIVVWVLIGPLIPILGYLLMHRGGRVTEWLQPFVVLAPVALLVFLDFERVRNLKTVVGLFFGVSFLILAGYATTMFLDLGGAGARDSYVQRTSAEINALWREKYNQPLRYVGGSVFSHWMTFYAPDRPRIVTPWSNEAKPNIYNARISMMDIQRDGVLFVSSPGLPLDEATLALDLSTVPGTDLREKMNFSFQNERGEEVTFTLGFVPPQVR